MKDSNLIFQRKKLSWSFPVNRELVSFANSSIVDQGYLLAVLFLHCFRHCSLARTQRLDQWGHTRSTTTEGVQLILQ